MTRPFCYAGSPAQIVFGNDSIGSVGAWIAKAGRKRALVLSTPHQKADAEELANKIGEQACGVFSGRSCTRPWR